MISVTIIEDDVELKDLWADFLNRKGEVSIVSSYTNCEGALEHLADDKPEVILLDITLNGKMCGIEGIRCIKKILPQTQIIMVTVNDDDDSIFDSLCAGANGYLIKNESPGNILEAILGIKKGAPPLSMSVASRIVKYFNDLNALDELSSREQQVLRELSHGHGYKQVADHLHISINTVKFHVKNIFLKLGVKNVAEAVQVAKRSKKKQRETD